MKRQDIDFDYVNLSDETSTEVSCKDFSQRSRDDSTEAGHKMFVSLFYLYLACLIYAIALAVLKTMWWSKRSRPQLILLYAFANMTLLGKYC